MRHELSKTKKKQTEREGMSVRERGIEVYVRQVTDTRNK